MVIIELAGGLGNQMFQYSLYESFLQKKIAAQLDTSFYSSNQKLRSLELNNFPNVQYETASIKEVSVLRGYGYHDSIYDKLRIITQRKRKNIYIENLDMGWQPGIYDLREVYLSGYWQSELYFKDIEDKIRAKFQFPQEITGGENKKYTYIKKQMQINEAVSIHVRRKDYLEKKISDIYGNICTEQYYADAVEYVRQHIYKPVFYIFSDDIFWAKEHFQGDAFTIVNEDSEWNDVADLYLMTQCKHHIIANSSFSWWGAWLGKYSNNMVVAPEKWFNNHEQTDMICADWIRI